MFAIIASTAAGYDLSLVGIAAAVCLVACWTALSLFHRAETDRVGRALWLIASGAVFGTGIWATHFIAEVAFRSSFAFGFDPMLTGASLMVAIVGGVGGFALVLARPGSALFATMGGATIGATMAAMQFIGMLALRFQGTLLWSPGCIAAAAAMGIGFSMIAVILLRRLAGLAARLVAVELLTFGIAAMHFIATAGTPQVMMATPVPALVLEGRPLALAIAAAVTLILLVSLAGAAWNEGLARRTEIELERERRLTDATFEGILFLRDGIVTQLNAALGRLLDAPAPRFIGVPVERLLPALADLGAPPWPREAREAALVSPDGTTRPVEVLVRPFGIKGGTGAVVAVRDIAERKEAAARIEFLAHHDPLTALPNRTLFNDRLIQALALADRSDGKVTLLYLDLDGFKFVNDAHGHLMGDRLLRAVADRISAELRETDTLGRLGGDEFAIVQPAVAQPNAAAAVARRVVELLSMPFDLDGVRIAISVSIGIALYPDDAEGAESLMMRADLALVRAKRDGRGMFCFFEQEMDQTLQRQRLLEQELRYAIAHDEFEIHYQKLCYNGSLAVVGHEALLRWNHPTRGSIPPSEFIPLAEAGGQILPLGRWMLEHACREAASWPRDQVLSVNISPIQFGQRDLVAMVGEILARTGLEPARLDIEITEGILIRNTARALQVLRGFKALGAWVTLDDFGTGYSSLGYLRRFPFDAIKIDRSFIRGLGVDREAEMIVRSIVALCRGLDLRVTAEGVETQEQLAALSEYGCDLVQGYLLGRPVSVAEMRRTEAVASA